MCICSKCVEIFLLEKLYQSCYQICNVLYIHMRLCKLLWRTSGVLDWQSELTESAELQSIAPEFNSGTVLSVPL